MRNFFGAVRETSAFGIHKFGHSAGFALSIDAGQHRGALAENDAGGRPFEGVGVFDAGTGDAGAGGGQVEGFVVKCGAAVLCSQLGNNEEDAGLFEIAVGQAVGAEQFGAAHFEPDGIDGVVDDAGLIGFLIAGNDLDGAFVDCCPGRKPGLRIHLVIAGSGFDSHFYNP